MKLYKSKDWLYRRYVVQKKSMEEIAKECRVTVMTIYRQLKDFGIIKWSIMLYKSIAQDKTT